jgi:hypothetical protein
VLLPGLSTPVRRTALPRNRKAVKEYYYTTNCSHEAPHTCHCTATRTEDRVRAQHRHSRQPPALDSGATRQLSAPLCRLPPTPQATHRSALSCRHGVPAIINKQQLRCSRRSRFSTTLPSPSQSIRAKLAFPVVTKLRKLAVLPSLGYLFSPFLSLAVDRRRWTIRCTVANSAAQSARCPLEMVTVPFGLRNRLKPLKDSRALQYRPKNSCDFLIVFL